MSAPRSLQPALESESSTSNNPAASASSKPNGATFFVPTLERLAATQLIQSRRALGLGGITQEYLLQNPAMEFSLKATLNALAAVAARLLLHGDTVAAEAMVEENPAILYCVVEEAKDHRGNKVKGTLLQIAALAGDCNIRDKQGSEKDHGMVERLKAYLPEEDATDQLQATRSVGWEQETAARMQPYFDAATKFLNDIINTPQAPDSDYEAFKTACEAHITKFRNTLALIPSQQPVIEKGLIFDPQIFLNVLDNLLTQNIERLGGWWGDKSDLFAVVGYGSLQACASVCDIQAIKNKSGLAGVINDGELPNRALNFVAAGPHVLDGLGDSFFVGVYGTQWGGSFAFGRGLGGGWRCFYQNYVRAKTASLQCVIQRPDNHAKNRCVIL